MPIKSQSYCRRPFWLSENGEDIQILRYGINESSAPNFDYYHENGGNRVAMVLMYLSTVTRGGETVFPKSQVMHPTLIKWFTYHIDKLQVSMKYVMDFCMKQT